MKWANRAPTKVIQSPHWQLVFHNLNRYSLVVVVAIPHAPSISDPSFVPEVFIKGAAQHSINIGWSYPPPERPELRNHVHYFKLLMTKNDLKEEAVVNANSDLMYAFNNLQSASTYYFRVSLVKLFELNVPSMAARSTLNYELGGCV